MFRKILLLSFVVLAGTLVLVMRPESSERSFRDAQRAFANDDFDRAAHLFREVTIDAPVGPWTAEAHFELAQIYYLRRRNIGAAQDRLVKLLQDFPGSAVERDAKRLLARLYDDDLQSPDKAIELYEQLIAESDDEGQNREILLDLADCHYRLGSIDASADAYRRALALSYDADSDRAYLRLANLESLRGSSDEALRLLIQLGGKTNDLDRRLEAKLAEVQILLSLERFDEAQLRLEQARGLRPGSADLADLGARVDAGRAEQQPLDGFDETELLQEQQKRIPWGGGRARRRPTSDSL